MTRNPLIHALPLALALLATACSAPSPNQAGTNIGVNEPILTTPLRPFAQPLVPVTINGKQYHFILDTGAPYTFIDNKTAEALTKAMPDAGVPAYFREYIEGLSTFEGALDKTRVTFWEAMPVFIGNTPVRASVPWVGIDLSMFDMSYGSHVDGLIGADLYRQLNWGFDNLTHTLTVWSLPPSTMGYSMCTPYEDGFGGGPDLPITLANGNGGPMRLDTGATYDNASTETLKAFAEHGAKVEKAGAATRLSANGLYETNRYLIDGLHFGGQPIGKLMVYESSASNSLGTGFLSRFDNYVLIPSEMLFCHTAGHFTRDDAEPVRVVELSAVDGRLLIGTASSRSDGLARGLEVDDILVSVNGKPVEPADIESLRRQLTETPAGHLSLVVERHGKQETVQL